MTFLNKFPLLFAYPVTRSKYAWTDSDVSGSATESEHEEMDADGVNSHGTISQDKGKTIQKIHLSDTLRARYARCYLGC